MATEIKKYRIAWVDDYALCNKIKVYGLAFERLFNTFIGTLRNSKKYPLPLALNTLYSERICHGITPECHKDQKTG